MTTATRRLAETLLKQTLKPQGIASFPARMGDSSGTISTGVAGYVNVRLYNGEVMEVFNNRVPVQSGWVMVGVDPTMPGLLQVLGPRDVFPEMPSSSNIGAHHETHELFGGGDVAWIHSQQIMALLAKPSETSGEEFTVQIYGGNVALPSGFVEVLYQKVDISASQPAAGALMVLLQVDDTGVVSSKDGTAVDSREQLSLSDVPLPDADHYPIWAVEVYDGQDNLRCDAELNDFHDLRFGGFAISGGAGYDMAATIHAASASAVTDSDEFGFWEDVSGLLKKITWANVQATLETYFDTQYQPLDATLTSLSALGTAADKMAYTTGVDTWAETGLTAFGRSIIDDANEATFKATVNLEIGTDVQAYDATLAALSALADASGVLTNDGAGNLSWAVAGGAPFVDTTAIVMGSGDNTKLLRFEVDGFTTATTRVVTPPNADITLAGQNYANVFTVNQMVDGSADDIQFRVQAHSTQTANLHTWETSAGTVMTAINGSGKLIASLGTSSTNFFVGGAGNTTTTGLRNVAIGTNALIALTSGTDNTAVGNGAMQAANSANENFALGSEALQQLTTGASNVAIGKGALQNIQTSGSNVAIGKGAGLGVGVGPTIVSNVFIGTQAANQAVSGTNYCVLIGEKAGYANGGQEKVAIGYYSGYYSTGNGNIFLGAYSGFRQTTGANLLVLDNRIRADVATEASNAILYGAMASTPASQTLRINAVTTIGSTVAGALVIGVGTAGIDYNITFNGETNDGVLTWMEDEDYFKFSDDVMMADAENIVLGTTTGTKIGTATMQKLGFWDVAPVVQPSGATQAAPAAYVTGGFGLDSDANMQALYDLVVAMRTALVNTGIMKGAA